VKAARLKIVSDGTFHGTEVYAVPEDGSEPLLIPCVEIEASVNIWDLTRATIHVVRASLDVVGAHGDDRIHVRSRGAFDGADVRNAAAETIFARRAVWRLPRVSGNGDRPQATVELELIRQRPTEETPCSGTS
jgi:hypothetical protein